MFDWLVDWYYANNLEMELGTFNLQILSRKTHMEEEIYNELVQKAVEEGYDVSKLHKTPQSNPPPETEEGPADTKGIWWFKSILGK